VEAMRLRIDAMRSAPASAHTQAAAQMNCRFDLALPATEGPFQPNLTSLSQAGTQADTCVRITATAMSELYY
jgi:hypothetical protein